MPRSSGVYFAIRVAVASSIMIAFYLTRGFGSRLETFVMAFAAALAAQGVAFVVKLAVGDQARNSRSALLLAGCVIAFAGSVVFVVIDEQHVDAKTGVRGILDMSTLRSVPREGDGPAAHDFVIVDGTRRINIHHIGALPDQLRDRTELVAKGQWRGDVFETDDLLAKCPTTYNTAEGPKPAAQFR
jgi:hypothetical protein